jgi:glycosyltransferase involved in cell wall biosynthesis
MSRPKHILFISFNGKSNAGGAERMLQYLEEWFIGHGFKTSFVDEELLKNTWLGKYFWLLFMYRHFKKRKPIYMARFASLYCWWRKRPANYFVSNGEATPFFPVDLVFCQGCYHAMELAYGRKETTLSRIAKLQMRGINLSKKAIAVTEDVRQHLVQYYKANAAKISVVNNRIDTSMFSVLPKVKNTYRTILYAGRLENGKGLAVILKLAELIEESKTFRLLIASNNSFNTDLFETYQRTEVVTGLHLHNINEEAYAKADLVIYPSLFESFGLIPLEALAAGVPVVANPVGIVPYLLQQQFPGIFELIPCTDASFLNWCNDIISAFEQHVDRNKLHDMVESEFGIASYRVRLDEVLGPSLKLAPHA